MAEEQGGPITLWLDESSSRELVGFLKGCNLIFNVKYVHNRPTPILFTGLGSFEGERSIRRAATVLMIKEKST